jgi:hypothetical protein
VKKCAYKNGAVPSWLLVRFLSQWLSPPKLCWQGSWLGLAIRVRCSGREAGSDTHTPPLKWLKLLKSPRPPGRIHRLRARKTWQPAGGAKLPSESGSFCQKIPRIATQCHKMHPSAHAIERGEGRVAELPCLGWATGNLTGGRWFLEDADAGLQPLFGASFQQFPAGAT